MNNYFLLNENQIPKNLLNELLFALPTKLLEIVEIAYFEFPDGKTFILKNRSEKPFQKSDSITFSNCNATEEEIQSLSGKIVEIKFSGFSKRGKNVILDYMASTYREQMKLLLEGEFFEKEK